MTDRGMDYDSLSEFREAVQDAAGVSWDVQDDALLAKIRKSSERLAAMERRPQEEETPDGQVG